MTKDIKSSISHYELPQYVGSAPAVFTVCNFVRLQSGLSPLLSHRHWILDYSISDCGLCRIGNKDQPWLPRHENIAHLYAPFTPHWEDTRNAPEPLVSTYCIFQGGNELGLQPYVSNSLSYARFYDRTGQLEKMMTTAAQEVQALGNKGFSRAQSWLYRIVELLHEAAAVGTDNCEWELANPKHSAEDPFITQAQMFLQMQLNEKFSLEDMAEELGLSTSGLSHKYRQATGQSPLQTLISMRINAAKKLLATGNSLQNIAAQTGFYDEFHLSKAFKKQTGLSPRKYMIKYCGPE